MNIQEVYEYLRDNKYLMASKGKYSFTKKWHDDLGTTAKIMAYIPPVDTVFDVERVDDRIAVINNGLILSQQKSMELLKTNPEVQRKAFLDFIFAAKIPRRLEGSGGNMYDVNKYSEEGFKVFQKCIASGIDISLLVKSTALYYASGTGFKKKIGNYLIDGDWRTDYLELLAAAEAGEESLKTHITEELDNGEHTVIIF